MNAKPPIVCLLLGALAVFSIADGDGKTAGKADKAKTETAKAKGEQILVADLVAKPPIIDGKADDSCWSLPTTRDLVFFTEQEGVITVKVRRDSKQIYVLVRFPADQERREHAKWRWDAGTQAYLPGDEKEETLSIVWTANPTRFTKADVWIWRSARSDPVGVADDYFCLRKSLATGGFTDKKQDIHFIPDAGRRAWYSRYFGDYVGETVPRFYHRQPEGSSADVKAKGQWAKGHWTVEFSRLLETGQNDDIGFSNLAMIYMQFQLSPPAALIKNYERFYRVYLKPEAKKDSEK